MIRFSGFLEFILLKVSETIILSQLELRSLEGDLIGLELLLGADTLL